MKDFLGLRPIDHFTEERVRGYIVLCVLGAVIEAVMGKDFARAGVIDPDLTDQVISPRRALAELDRIRLVACTRTADRSASSRSATPSRQRSSPPSASTPRAGTRPTSPDWLQPALY